MTGQTHRMQGHHALPMTTALPITTALRRLRLKPALTKERRHGRHARPGRIRGRRHRRILAYRAIELLQSPAPEGKGRQCLLLVHIRKVIGQVMYQVCGECAQGVITDVAMEDQFHGSGLGTRALSHLRARYPGVAWRSTLDRRLTRDLLRRMRIPAATAHAVCSHLRPTDDDDCGVAVGAMPR